MKPRRSYSVTLLACVVLIVAVVNWIRLEQALVLRQLLATLLTFSPAYLILSGLVWGLALLPLAGGLWRGATWAPWYLRITTWVYSVYFWLDRLFLPVYPGRNVNWPFALALNLTFLAWSLWILSRPKVKIFFGEAHEHGVLER